MLGFVAVPWLFLVASSGGYSPVVALRLLVSVASRCGAWTLERGLNSRSARASLPRGVWNLPGPGIEPMFPALAGGFLTTGPPGKSHIAIFKIDNQKTWCISQGTLFNTV